MDISDIHTHTAGRLLEETIHEYLHQLTTGKDTLGIICKDKNIYFFIATLLIRNWK